MMTTTITCKNSVTNRSWSGPVGDWDLNQVCIEKWVKGAEIEFSGNGDTWQIRYKPKFGGLSGQYRVKPARVPKCGEVWTLDKKLILILGSPDAVPSYLYLNYPQSGIFSIHTLESTVSLKFSADSVQEHYSGIKASSPPVIPKELETTPTNTLNIRDLI
jgi:hypothetical protein